MAKQSKIEWTDATWNPWYGCTKVSEGCRNCYAERDMKRYGKSFKVTRSKTTFTDPLKWKEPRKIFTCSWSDFFHPDAEEWRPEAWNIIDSAPQHTYLILTKRPELIRRYLPPRWGAGWPQVWLGVSVELQSHMHRLGCFYEIPARIKFVSAEPLLGPLDFSEHMGFVDWVIVGGESGKGHRKMDPRWAYSIFDECHTAGVPFFMKQMSGRKPIPHDLMIRETPCRSM